VFEVACYSVFCEGHCEAITADDARLASLALGTHARAQAAWTSEYFCDYHSQRSPGLGEDGAAWGHGREVARGRETRVGNEHE